MPTPQTTSALAVWARAAFGVLLCCCVVSPAAGQRLPMFVGAVRAPGVAAGAHHGVTPLHPPQAADSLVLPPTYWKEGAAIGGIALGIPMVALGYTFCKGVSDTGGCLGTGARVGVLMGFCGAVIGALIGGAIEKKETTESPTDP